MKTRLDAMCGTNPLDQQGACAHTQVMPHSQSLSRLWQMSQYLFCFAGARLIQGARRHCSKLQNDHNRHCVTVTLVLQVCKCCWQGEAIRYMPQHAETTLVGIRRQRITKDIRLESAIRVQLPQTDAEKLHDLQGKCPNQGVHAQALAKTAQIAQGCGGRNLHLTGKIFVRI